MQFNLFKIFSEKPTGKLGYISSKNETKEAFKGEVSDIPINFPKSLGAAHPFNFEAMEAVYKTIGVINGGINKITDSVVGDFSYTTKTKEANQIISDFIKNTNFTSALREWIREGFSKGNGFLELDLKGKGIQVLNANTMYVVRDDKGKVTGYNQWIGDLKRYRKNKKEVNNFKPAQIAHLRINKIAGEPYGIGIIYPNERTIENMVLNEQDLQKLISRKAGAPIHAAVGREGEAVNIDDVDAFKDSLQVMNNRTEWVTDSNVKMNVIDFGQIGKNLTDVLDHDMLLVAFGMEIPIVLFGGGNIPEGLAKAQSEIFQRKMAVIQEEIESIIEEHIFKPLLEAYGSTDEVDFTWNLPGEEEINNRIDRLTKLIESMNTSEPLRRMAELEIAKLLDLEDAPKYLSKPEKETPEDEQKPPEDDKQPEYPKDKPKEDHIFSHNIYTESEREETGKMSIKEFANLKENKKMTYSDYLQDILTVLKTDKFEFLAAITSTDIANGKLSGTQIEKLRDILQTAFKENQTIKEIEKEITDTLDLKDVKKDGKVIVKSSIRPNTIARTETVRAANKGLIKTYKKNDIKKVKWLAAVSERTCEICNALHGQVFDINTVSPPPIHPRCRCSLLAIIK